MTTRQLSPKRPDRSYRVEIPKPVKLAVFRRAGGPEAVRCEGECGLLLRGKPFEYHHRRDEWTWNLPKSQRPPITPDDVLLLCVPCHAGISAIGSKDRSHGKRIVEKAARAEPKSRSSFACSRDGPFKVSPSGKVTERATGRVIREGR